VTAAPPLLLRAPGRVLVGHLAVGNAVAGLMQRRSDDPARSFTATLLGAGEPVHGANAGGLVCAALDVPGHALVAAVLAGADDAGEAVALLEALPAKPRRAVTLLLADEANALVASVSPDAVLVRAAAFGGVATDRSSVFAALREAEPPPEPGAAPAAALAAVLARDAPPELYIALGPPGCSAFIRYWPGVEQVPDVSASPEGAPLARLAAAVAQATGSDGELRGRARARLDLAEFEALREADAAESMAALMDEHTDDRGAAIRRLVAQSYAAGLVGEALEELAVPASRGGDPGPRL